MKKILISGISIFFASTAVYASGDEYEKLELFSCDTATNLIEIKLNDDEIRIPPSGKGETHVFILKDKSVTAKGKEEKRKSRISDDIATLIDLRNKKLSLPKYKCVKYTQKYKRATLKLNTLDGNGKKIGNYILISGPEEHWYLSADMPVNSIKQLSFDTKSNSVIEKEKPASFYLGLNWKIGDVYTNYKSSDIINNLSLKAIFKASSSPSESMGVGIGYSFKHLDIFVAQVWTKDDESAGGKNSGNTKSTIFGVSFNLSKALNWAKSN